MQPPCKIGSTKTICPVSSLDSLCLNHCKTMEKIVSCEPAGQEKRSTAVYRLGYNLLAVISPILLDLSPAYEAH